MVLKAMTELLTDSIKCSEESFTKKEGLNSCDLSKYITITCNR